MNRIFFQGLEPKNLLFGKYRILRCLHASDIAGVYLCQSPEYERVVLKISLAKHRADEQGQRILEREITLAKRISHKNVLSPIECYEDDEFFAFAMEYLPGGTLDDLIVEDVGIRPMQLSIENLRGIASGLTAIHKEGIVHGDIKPHNILLDNRLQPRIADFGLSCHCAEYPIPFEDCIVGTLNYLAPEYILNGETKPSGDLYSFGVLACEVFTGRNPSAGASVYDTLKRRMGVVNFKLSNWNPLIPKRVEEVIIACLSFKPEARPTAEEVLSLLSAAAPYVHKKPEPKFPIVRSSKAYSFISHSR